VNLNLIPPHNSEAERAVLGGIMVDNGQLAVALGILQPDDFFGEPNRKIFGAMVSLDQRRSIIDPVTVKEELRRQDAFDAAGGPTYIASLIDSLSSSANVGHYAQVVRDLSEERRKVEEAIQTLQGLPRISNAEAEDDVSRLLTDAGIHDLGMNPALGRVEMALRELRKRLNGADPLRYRLVREGAVRAVAKLGVRTAAAVVDAAMEGRDENHTTHAQGQPLTLSEPEPWPDAVDGAEVVGDLLARLTRHLALPPGGALALTLWIVHAHAHEAAIISPMLALKSATKRAGKTTALTLIGALVPKPLLASNVTGAALFRTVEKFTPTLLVDEADSFLAQSDELRGILNSGHTRAGAVVVRTVGETYEPRCFSTWSPKVIALIGNLPATLEDRSILISMRRKSAKEKVERLRFDRLQELEPLRRRVARWASDNLNALRSADASVPEALHDRARDNWRPLLAIADLCGSTWPNDARWAALTLSGDSDEREGSPAVQLLSDLRVLYEARQVERLPSDEIVRELIAQEDRPWPEWRKGKPLTATQLAALLRPFDVRPRELWVSGRNLRGYLRADLEDAFARYLPPDTLGPLEVKRDAGSCIACDPLENDKLAAPGKPPNARLDDVLAELAVPEPPSGSQDCPDATCTGRPCAAHVPASPNWNEAEGIHE
jgi:Protein of unknown function (DUF3631)/DnaB-like helicase N terminal domain